MSNAYFDKHRETLDNAVNAIRSRDYWTPFPEMPSGKIYGETAMKDGSAAFKGRLGKRFELDMPGIVDWAGAEKSPYGIDIGVQYPIADMDVLLPEMIVAMQEWRDYGVEGRAGVCVEILKRLNARSYEIAFAVMHTSGQGFMMSFQAGGPHAQDRGLEAVAYGYEAMSHTPGNATWSKPQGKHDPLVMEKKFTVVPRGVGMVVGCSTFPTWNTYPGMFASLVTGNPVLLKPHSGGILPAAITVEIAQEVLREAGLPTHLVAMAVSRPGERITKELATRPEVKLIDYTGNTDFGNWLEANATQALVYTEKAGLNTVVIDNFDDVKGMARNMAFSLSLYTGQMCTTPQNIFVPRDGIDTADGHLSFDEVAQALATGVQKFLSDNDRACEVLGAVQSDATASRLENAGSYGELVLASEARENARFEGARVLTPAIVKLDAAKDADKYEEEVFGAVSFIIATDGTDDSIARALDTTKRHGAITWGVYASSEETLAKMEEASLEAGVALSINLTGGVFVNQSAAYSDFHATGANPASNACLADSAFVSNRFRVVQSRRHPSA